MFQYAAGRSLSLQVGTRLYLDTTDYESCSGRAYALEVFRISAKPLAGWQGICGRQLRRKRYKCLTSLLQALHVPIAFRYLDDAEDRYRAKVTKTGCIAYLDGYWQHESYFSGIRGVLLRDFAFKESPDDENRTMLARIISENAVCTHVRRGDYTTPNGRAFHGVCEVSYYNEAIRHIQERVSNPHFFVFSDDPQWVVSNLPGVERMTIVTHNCGGSATEDLRLMMNCRHFIIANSSFSWWAAWLANAADKIVVAPKQWYASPVKRDDDPALEGWTRL